MPNYKNGRTLRERVFSRLKPQPNGCLVWTGHCSPEGYGRVQAGTGRPQYVHRVVYLLLQGQILGDLELDHLCRNRKCANPDHLEPVTHAENVRRGYEARKAAV